MNQFKVLGKIITL